MAGVGDICKTAPAVGNFLVLGERVGDQCKGALVGLEGLCQRLRRRLALLTGAVLQQVERRLNRELLGSDFKTERRDGLVEQPVPGRITALRFLVKQLLDTVFELIRLVLAQILDPGPEVPEFGRLHRAFDHTIVNTIQLEREKQQMHRRRGQPLGNVAVEFGDRGIDAVAGMNEAGVGTETACEIVDRLVTPHRFGKPASAIFLGGVFRKFALVVGLKRDAFFIHLLQITRRLPARRCRNKDRRDSIPATCRPC